MRYIRFQYAIEKDTEALIIKIPSSNEIHNDYDDTLTNGMNSEFLPKFKNVFNKEVCYQGFNCNDNMHIQESNNKLIKINDTENNVEVFIDKQEKPVIQGEINLGSNQSSVNKK